MNSIDIIILLWLIVSIIRGYHIGLLRQAASFAGFTLGLFGGAWAASVFLDSVEDTGTKLAAVLILTFGLGLLGAGVAEMLAVRLQQKVRLNLAQTFNAVFGAVFSAATTLILVWLLLSVFNRLPLAQVGLGISESRVYQGLERVMPPAPAVLERLGRIITPYGFPQIFVDNEPQVVPAAPPASADVEAAAAKARNAVVRIEGYACGDISSGSGFVTAPGFVATNAHVVAGVDMPVVVWGDKKYRAIPVWFDSGLDFAVLRVDGLDAPVLPIAAAAHVRGQSGAVLGHPEGGPLAVNSGVILNRHQAVGRDIYGQGLVTREIYEIQAEIHPGNSGGPFVLPNGTVAGVMFGASTSQPNISYAIMSTEIAGGLQRAIAENSPVATGACL